MAEVGRELAQGYAAYSNYRRSQHQDWFCGGFAIRNRMLNERVKDSNARQAAQ